MQLPGRQTVDHTYKIGITPLSSTLTTHEIKTSRIQNPSLKTLSLPTASMEGHNIQSETTGVPSTVPPFPPQATPEESPATPPTTHAPMEQADPITTTIAPALPPVSGIPTEIVVKLFQFLQPDIDIGQMFAQFMATRVAPPQSEAEGKADDEERLSETVENKDDEEKDVAVKATETRIEGAGEAHEHADPRKEAQEGGTRRRHYHKVVVKLSDEEENDDERTQISLTKWPRTYRQTHPQVATSRREVSPQVESQQHPPREQRQERSINREEARKKIKRGEMPANTPAKEVKEVPGQESRPLTLG